MSVLVGPYTHDEARLFQFAQTALDGGLRHAYQLSIGCIRERTVIHNCLIELLSYRVSEAVYRVRIGVYRVRSLCSSNLFEYFSQQLYNKQVRCRILVIIISLIISQKNAKKGVLQFLR